MVERGRTHVNEYRRRDGTRVRSHDRQDAWRQAGAAWAGAGISLITTLALLAEFGLTLVSTVALILTALLGLAAVYATKQVTKNKRKVRSQAKARKRPAKRRPTRTRTKTRKKKPASWW